MMWDRVGEAGAKLDAFGFSHRTEHFEVDSFGYLVEEQNPDTSTERDGGHQEAYSNA
jgi:hypothetical protein